MFTPNPRHCTALRAMLSCLAVSAALLLAAPTESNDAGQNKGEKPESQSRDDSVRLHSDLVVVNVVVTDAKGEYAHGLTSKDFAVSEDGAPQSLDSFLAEEAAFAAAILIDMSGSMEYKFSLVRAAAASFLDQIRENDQVAVYGFNDKIKMFQDFSDLRDISDYVWDAKAENTTRLYDCAGEAISALE